MLEKVSFVRGIRGILGMKGSFLLCVPERI